MSEEIDLKQLLFLILRGWKCIILFVVLCVGIGYFFTTYTYTPYYRTSASMVITSQQTRIINGELILANDVNISQKLVNTYRVILLSDRVLNETLAQLDYEVKENPQIQVSSPGGSEVIVVTVTHKNPQIAMDFANALMNIAPEVIMSTIEVGSVNVLDRAIIPKYPIPINLHLNLAISFILGSMLGVFVVFFNRFLCPKIDGLTTLKVSMKLDVLGIIPQTKQKRNKAYPLILGNRMDKSYVEALKLTAAHFKHQCDSKGFRSVLVTSAHAKEGKTSTAYNLAICLKQLGHKVLFIDSDFFKCSTLDKYKKMNTPSKDWLDVLEKKCAPHEAIYKDVYFGIDRIDSRKYKEDTLKVLKTSRLKPAINCLKESYDYILIDSPPVNPVSDAIHLSQCVDGVLFVVREDYECLEDILDAKERLQKVNINWIGTVLNGSRYGRVKKKYKNQYDYQVKVV